MRYLYKVVILLVGLALIALIGSSWSMDSEANGFEKMESGLNYRSIDMAKIGSMLFNGGIWESEIIISSDWLVRSFSAPVSLDEDDYRGTFLESSGIRYQYMW